MAKRLTDSTKWNDDWFFNLNNEEKLAWIYILDTCDHAGIWKKNIRLLNFHTGSNFLEDNLKNTFAGKFIEIKDKWFIPNFIKFQYGKTFLTSNTKAVISARELLIDIGFIQQDVNGSLTLIKELANPMPTLSKELGKGYDRVKDKDKDKEMDKEMDEDKDLVMDKLKRKDELKNILMDKFKNINNIKKILERNDMDVIKKADEYLFNLNFGLISEYQSIKI